MAFQLVHTRRIFLQPLQDFHPRQVAAMKIMRMNFISTDRPPPHHPWPPAASLHSTTPHRSHAIAFLLKTVTRLEAKSSPSRWSEAPQRGPSHNHRRRTHTRQSCRLSRTPARRRSRPEQNESGPYVRAVAWTGSLLRHGHSKICARTALLGASLSTCGRLAVDLHKFPAAEERTRHVVQIDKICHELTEKNDVSYHSSARQRDAFEWHLFHVAK